MWMPVAGVRQEVLRNVRSGGLVGGASGCSWQESGGRCLGMHASWFRREVQLAAGVRLQVHRAACGEVRCVVSGERCIQR